MNANPQLELSLCSKSPAGNKQFLPKKELLPLRWENCSLTQNFSCGTNLHTPLLIQKWQGAWRAIQSRIQISSIKTSCDAKAKDLI